MTAQLLSWMRADGQPAISVVFGRRFAIGARGECLDTGEYAMQEEFEYYDPAALEPRTGYIQPSLLRRDIDIYPYRERTDLVVQATARYQRPVRRAQVDLRCRGAQTDLAVAIEIHGDRRIEQGPTGLILSEPEPFEAMPLRLDKAYGGTDEGALARDSDREQDRMIFELVGADEDREISEFSYWRNPAGKGYVVSPESALGTAWPNLELPDQRLSLAQLISPADEWGARPYPISFDWFPHAFFPRMAFFGEIPPIAKDEVPKAEIELGVLPADLRSRAVLERPKHGFAQGAHPYLWRHRLVGDEQIGCTAIGPEGAPLLVQLPGLRPRVNLRPLAGEQQQLPAELDLVLIEADAGHLTLVWRASLAVERGALVAGWDQNTPYSIDWR